MQSARCALLLAAVLVGLCVALASAQKPVPPSPSPKFVDPNPGAITSTDGQCNVYNPDTDATFCPLTQPTCSFNAYRCWRLAFRPSQKIIDPYCFIYPTWRTNCLRDLARGVALTGASDWDPNNALNGQENLNITYCGTQFVNAKKRSKSGGLFDADAYFGPQQQAKRGSWWSSSCFADVNRDWRTSNAVSAVTDQGSASSCWAHATVATLEFAWSQVNHFARTPTPMSTQQLIDCSYPFGNGYGAQGRGAPNNAFAYLMHAGSFWGSSVLIRVGDPNVANSYSMSAPGSGCRHSALGYFDSSYGGTGYAMGIGGYVSAWMNGNETTLQTIADHQVAAVGYYASTSFKQFVGTGTYSNSEWITINATTQVRPTVNHAIALIGVYSLGNSHYFIIKNSYGTAWGDSGFAKMTHDGTNNGGIAMWAWWPTGATYNVVQ